MAKRAGLTYEDLAKFPDDDVRRELFDGELLVSPSPRVRHQGLVGRLYLTLAPFVRDHALGRVYVAPLDVVLANDMVLIPDLIFLDDEHLGRLDDKNLKGPPRLAIEVMSDPRRDRVMKHEAYARFGVPEYWIVDPDSDWVEVYLLDRDTQRYAGPTILRPGDTLTSDAFPGLEIDLAELFRPD